MPTKVQSHDCLHCYTVISVTRKIRSQHLHSLDHSCVCSDVYTFQRKESSDTTIKSHESDVNKVEIELAEESSSSGNSVSKPISISVPSQGKTRPRSESKFFSKVLILNRNISAGIIEGTKKKPHFYTVVLDLILSDVFVVQI